MKCTNCEHHFCWICMGDWSDHGPQTGGYYICNLYQEKVKDESFRKEEEKKAAAARDMRRYEFYFKRYINHEHSERKAKSGKNLIEMKMAQMVEDYHFQPHEVEFLREAYDQVIFARETLKWTYAYIYYHETEMDMIYLQLYREWQANLERHCEALHEMIERPLDIYLSDKYD